MAPSRPADASQATPLQPARLLLSCPALGTATQLCVAFSGGLDSTVLLHLLVQLRDSDQLAGSLRALHINHGLQAVASAWAQHCRELCARWQVPLDIVEVQVAAGTGESPEAAARTARYEAFRQHLWPGELLVQAHHQDDQAETLLLRLLRGSGVRGLAAIPPERELGEGALSRPLLQLSRAELRHYAETHALSWVEDPSNADSRFDRNYLRHSVMPALQARWPQAPASLARSAMLEQEAATLLDELALADWQSARTDFPNRLRLPALQQLSAARARNLLGYWLQHQPAVLQVGKVQLHVLLQRCIDELVAPRDQQPRLLVWGTGEYARCLHRYRDALYLLKPLPAPPAAAAWSLQQPLALPEPLGVLVWQGGPLPEKDSVIVRFRQGGETLALQSGQHKTLKNFLQERGIPPWLRDHIPLLYHNETLIAAGDILLQGIDIGNSGEKSNPLQWQRSELLCGY